MKKVLVAYRIDKNNSSEKGIYLKMLDIVTSLESLNYEVDFICLEGRRMYSKSLKTGKLVLTRDGFYKGLFQQVEINSYDLIYLRFTPFSFFMGSTMIKVKRLYPEIKVLVEMPTYPFIKEYKGLKRKIINSILSNKWKVKNWADAILHLGPEEHIFGVKTIAFDNGILTSKVNLKKSVSHDDKQLRLLSVSKLWKWQGIDTLIEGIAKFYKNSADPTIDISLQIIGDGPELDALRSLTKRLNIESKVIFEKAQYNEDLDQFFEKADIAVGVLKDDQRGFKYVSALKHRNFAARGIPFFYGLRDKAFDDCDHVLYLKDEIDIRAIVRWYQNVIFPNYKESSKALRSLAERDLEWSMRLSKALDQLDQIREVR